MNEMAAMLVASGHGLIEVKTPSQKAKATVTSDAACSNGRCSKSPLLRRGVMSAEEAELRLGVHAAVRRTLSRFPP